LVIFLQRHGDHRDLHSFPTRRSSDLPALSVSDALATPPSTSTEAWPVRMILISMAAVLLSTWRASTIDALPEATATSIARPSPRDRKSTRLNSSHVAISYAVFCLKKK